MSAAISRRKFLTGASATLFAPAVIANASTQGVIRFVVPFAPGGSVDILGRLLGRYLTELIGQTIIIENRSGAGGNLAFNSVAQSEPDGLTYLLASETFIVNPSFMQTVPYDPVKDFKPVMLIASLSQLLFVNPSWVRDFAGFIDLAKSRSEGLDVATQGNGSPGHFATALMAQQGLKLTSVPHRGGGPAIQSVVSGHIPAGITTLPGAIGLVKEGMVRPIAVSTKSRSSFLPDIPTMNELVPGAVVDGWQAMFAPAGTPANQVERMNRALAAVMKLPEVHEALLKQCFEPIGGAPDELERVVRSDLEAWRKIVEKTNIRGG
jgi:tripartite-type tricarboxylate transporter receptor subunit TctC